MRIRLEDALELPTKNAVYLRDHLVRFELDSVRQFNPDLKFHLGKFSSPDEVCPEAPNRSAVQKNLTDLGIALDKAIVRIKDSLVFETRPISYRPDSLLFAADHFCQPTHLYTNE